MNKQIKELEEYLKYIIEDKTWTIKKLAKELTNLGYQKVDKNSVMLSMEEFEKINFYKELYEETYMRERKLNEFNSNLIIDNQTLKDKLELKGKETAREIFAKIKQKGQFEYFAYDDDKYCVSSDNLEELAKQYGVEIKE